MTVTAEKKVCSRCGQETTAEIPEGLSPRLQRALESFGVLCGDCAPLVQAEDEAAEAEERAAEEAQALTRNLAGANLPRTLQGLTFEAIAEALDDERWPGCVAARDKARLWAQGEINQLVLSGAVGVGKSWIAGAAVNEMARHRPVRWFSFAKLMAQARAGFKNPSRDEVTDVLTKSHLALVLDDIDKVKPSEYANDILFELIDERIANATPLLITTNRNYTELTTLFGEPITSRLKEGAGQRIEGKDRRGG